MEPIDLHPLNCPPGGVGQGLWPSGLWTGSDPDLRHPDGWPSPQLSQLLCGCSAAVLRLFCGCCAERST